MNNYSHTFLQVGLGTLGVAVVMFILKFILDKFIYGRRARIIQSFKKN